MRGQPAQQRQMAQVKPVVCADGYDRTQLTRAQILKSTNELHMRRYQWRATLTLKGRQYRGEPYLRREVHG
jgi:hypothetical protein